MTGDSSPLRRAAKAQLDSHVKDIELTLISIIQGLALGVLAAAAVGPLIVWQWQIWPYVVAGLLVILIFWSRSLIHTLSFIGWPLEFGHTFLYFGATLIEAIALSQVAAPERWFALNALYATAVWWLYAYDLRVVRDHRNDFGSESELALFDDIVCDQQLNIRWLMPLAVGFQTVSWWLVHAYPRTLLDGRWHLLLIGLSVLFSLSYLFGSVALLRRRQEWIVQRHMQEH